MLQLSKRLCFQEWSLWIIRIMDPWATWRNPVMCHGEKTCCKTLGFSMMYILARLCAWCCIHCPSGGGPGCYFYHFTLTSIIKLVYWVRQYRRLILFCLLCSSASFPITSVSCINRDSPPPQCVGASLVAGPWPCKRVRSAYLKMFTNAIMRVRWQSFDIHS